jgi:hypothetical protein
MFSFMEFMLKYTLNPEIVKMGTPLLVEIIFLCYTTFTYGIQTICQIKT